MRPARALLVGTAPRARLAGWPRHALPLIDDDTLLIVNGDTLCDMPIRALYDAHIASGALVTLGLMPHPQPGRYGGVVLDGGTGHTTSGAVTAFVPRTSSIPSVHFPGIQLVHRSVLPSLPDDGTPAESVLQVYPQLMASRPGVVRGVVFDAHFDDVGTVQDYRRTCRTLAGDARRQRHRPQATVAADARLRGCIVWPGASVPPALRPRRRRRHGPRHASRRHTLSNATL